jgi:GrpB-like predicted nucleotidyltransferase (UPF0157 family)/GNAT superfamily N-acetyltransferase
LNLIRDYNPEWPILFQTISQEIRLALGTTLISIHHVGSTSVPGLVAKPFVDILLITNDQKLTIPLLEIIGFSYRGEINIPFQAYFKKKTDWGGYNVHCFEEEHPEIELNLEFRNHLRQSPESCKEYEKLKKLLSLSPEATTKHNSSLMNYTLGKQPFIQDSLKTLGFDRLCLRFCTHYEEWEEFHRLRKTLFKDLNVEYDRNHPTINDPHHYSFALYRGAQIVGAAFVQLLDNSAILRSLVIDENHQKKGYGAYLLLQLEKWVHDKNRSTLYLHSSKNAIEFYFKQGYTAMCFEDKSIDPGTIRLGRRIK